MKRLIRICGVAFALLTGSSLMAQISHGGQPFSQTHADKNQTATYVVAKPSQHTIDDYVAANDRNGSYPVIATSVNTQISLSNSGTWQTLSNGDRIWKAVLSAQDAQGLIVSFSSFHIPQGGKLFLYSPDFKQVAGSYTEENNHSSGSFTVGVIRGTKVVVEYYEPQAVQGQGSFIIDEVGYVFRMATPSPLQLRNFGDSDPCEVNVNCTPEGSSWQDEKRGVVRILVKEGAAWGWCSGSVVNNTNQDCTPYVLLALHCGVNSSVADMNQWVFYFNYEAPGCSNPGSQGTLANQSMTGCSRIADANDNGGATGSDFLLVLLNNNIPAGYNAYYNGWNANNTVSSSGVGIHHPAGDIKKISTYTANTVSSQWNGNGLQSHWRVVWSSTTNGWGVTEGGSSGSPLFNAAGQIIGTLTGGSSYCTATTSPDYYGKMYFHWDQNTTPGADMLKTYLDPGNTGVKVLGGTYAPCGSTPPTCNISASSTTIQAGQTVSFTDNSTGVPTSWSWNFGGGGTPATSTQQNPSGIAFNTAGTYTVTMIATNANGSCTTSVVINVLPQTGCDTLNWVPPGTLTVYNSGTGVYVCGWNQYGDVSKAEYIGSHAPYTHVNSMLIYFYDILDGGNGATVDFNIWDNTGAAGSPGTILSTVNIPLSALAGALTGSPLQGVLQIDFPTAVNVGNNPFYIGITMNGFGTGDRLGIVSNTDGDSSPGTAWEEWSAGGGWYAISDATNSWGLNISQVISPLMTNVPPTANITTSGNTICSGGSVTFNGTTSVNAQGYTWTFPGGSPTSSTSSTVNVTYNTPGTYWAYLEVDGVCAGYDVDSVMITVNAVPNVNITPNTVTICAGASTTLTASGGTTYSWSPATGLSATTGATVTASPTTTTTYTVIGTTNGCSDPGTATVTVNPAPSVSVSPSTATICSGNSTVLTASGATTYSWSPATGLSATTGATVTASPTTTTTYTVTGTTSGCTGTATATVTVNATPSVSVNPPNPGICTGGSVGLTASGATTYSWSPATGLSATTGANVTASPTSTITYTVTGTTGSCSSASTVTVTVAPSLTVGVSPSAPSICNGNSTTLVATGASTYSWSPATGLSATTGATVTASPTTTTTYTVTGTSGSCSGTTTVTVTVNPTPSVNVSPTTATICAGNSTALTASGATTYSWSPATGLSATTGANVTASPASTTTYTVTGTTGGCSGTATATVTVNPSPSVSVSPSSASICSGSSTSLTASGATTYSWSPATGLSATTGATVTASPTSTTTYTVTGTTGSCTGTSTVVVTVNPNPAVSVSPATVTVCAGGSTTLTASGATSYSWSPATGLSATTGSTVTATPSSTITYTVTGTTSGCTGTGTSVVTVDPAAVAVATSDVDTTYLSAGGTVNFSSTGSTGTAGWDFGDGNNSSQTNPSYNYTSTGTYTVILTATNGGCTDTDTLTIVVLQSNGVAENGIMLSFNVFPNPTNGAFTVEASFTNGYQVKLRLVNVLGEITDQRTINSASFVKETFDLKNNACGIYFLQMEAGNNRWIQKVQVIK